MRTTIRVDDALLAEAKRYAAESNQTLTVVIDTALRLMLERRKRPRARPPVKLTTIGGKGLRPGVDLGDSASLLDLMDYEGQSGLMQLNSGRLPSRPGHRNGGRMGYMDLAFTRFHGLLPRHPLRPYGTSH